VAQGRLDLDAAATHGRDALQIGLALPDDVLVAHASLFLAPLVPHVAGLAAEVPTLDDVLTSVRRAGLTSSETYVLPMLVDDLIAEGDLDRATELAIAAFDLLADAPDSAATVPNLVVAVNLCVALGEDDQAAFLLGALGSSAAMVLALAPPQNRARHATAVATLEDRHGFSIGRQRGAGATADRATAVESTLRILLRHRAATEAATSVALTPREREVLGLLTAGMTNKEIGVELGFRPKTVMHHTTAIYRKLGVRGRSEAVVLALRRGLTAL
jgi:DNA-binding CsgD family transcriptional regulator